MNNEIRLSLSGAREDDSQPLHIATEGSLNQLPTKHRKGWTPAPTRPMYSQTNVSLAHKGRDYDAILRAAKRKPVGYWEDAPRGIKFGGGGNTEKASGLTKADTTQNATAPAPQQSADSPWPKCTKMAHSKEYHPWRTETEGIWFNSAGLKGVCDTPSFTRAMTRFNRIEVSRAEMAGFLEAHGHKDAAAQLRGKAICPQKPAQ